MKKALFWLASCTWGFIMTAIGAAAALALLLTGHRPKLFHGFVVFEFKYGWGGVDFGPFIIVNKGAPLDTLLHETGHGLQNVILGPLMPFLVAIPSGIRWNIYRRKNARGELHTLPPYDSIWFEGWATALGKKHFGKVVER